MRLREREGFGDCGKAAAGGNLEEGDTVLPRQIGDGKDMSLFSQICEGEGGNVAHVDASLHNPAAFAH